MMYCHDNNVSSLAKFGIPTLQTKIVVDVSEIDRELM